MSNINMEFNMKFDNEDYIITIQTTQDKLLITIEEEKNSVYWKKELDAKTICDITSQMGSFKSFDVFTKMLLCALQNENENISLNFCSLNEIQQLSENKKRTPRHQQGATRISSPLVSVNTSASLNTVTFSTMLPQRLFTFLCLSSAKNRI